MPLNTVSFNTLPAHLRTDGTSILTLIRNVASSIGIAFVIAYLTRTTTACRALAEHVTPFNDALQAPDVARTLDLATDQGRALADQMMTQQAADHGLRQRFHAADGDLRAVDPVRVLHRLDRLVARRAGIGTRSRAERWIYTELLPHLLSMLAQRRDAPKLRA